MTATNDALPEVIATYLAVHDRQEVDSTLATFTADAVVVDEGHEWTGVEQIREWLTTTSSRYTFTRTLLGAEPSGSDGWLVRNHLEGDFPGGEVDLRYLFTLGGGRIARLEIVP